MMVAARSSNPGRSWLNTAASLNLQPRCLVVQRKVVTLLPYHLPSPCLCGCPRRIPSTQRWWLTLCKLATLPARTHLLRHSWPLRHTARCCFAISSIANGDASLPSDELDEFPIGRLDFPGLHLTCIRWGSHRQTRPLLRTKRCCSVVNRTTADFGVPSPPHPVNLQTKREKYRDIKRQKR
jgi:hypothetical protein